MIYRSRLQHGQAGLIVLLIVTVVLTIGVSVATRSVSQLKTSRQEEDATQAFNLAEQGIEDLLSRDNLVAGEYTDGDNKRAVNNITDYSIDLEVGEVVEIDLADATANGTFNLSWTPPSPPCGLGGENDLPAAIVVTLYSANGGIRRQGYDNCGSYGFTPLLSTSTPIDYFSTDLFARVRIVRKNTTLTVSGINLPQGLLIASQAEGEDVTRTIEVDKFNPTLPNIFEYALFSGSDIAKE